jgi:hypothetical protein
MICNRESFLGRFERILVTGPMGHAALKCAWPLDIQSKHEHAFIFPASHSAPFTPVVHFGWRSPPAVAVLPILDQR